MRIAPLLLVLAACPAKPVQPPPQPVAGVGCPTAQNVYLASYVRPANGQPGYSGWTLPLHNATVDSVEGKPAFGAIDAAAATAAGVPPPPQSVWLMPPNAPMCKATVGGYYVEAIDGKVKNLAYGATLGGCPAPEEGLDGAIALVSVEPPNLCQAISPRPVASRVGRDDGKTWTRPTQDTPIPEAIAKLVPERACDAPGCEKLWSVAQVDIANKPLAWAAAVNWIEIPPNADPATKCTWKTDTFSGFFIAGPDGAPVKVTEGQDHPLSLFVVLLDKLGPKVMIADGVGEYATYDVSTPGAATVGRHLVWYSDDPAVYGQVDRLGPECNGAE